MNPGSTFNSIHRSFMAEALKEARLAFDRGEVPVGAVIVSNNRIIARNHNKRESENDATFHAEIGAIRDACRALGTWRLSDCDLYVTLEPCVMCAGAIIQARIRTLYIGTMDKKGGAAGSVLDVFSVRQLNHKVEVVHGILEEECAAIMKEFFVRLRFRYSPQ